VTPTPPTPPRAALYLRVSTPDQAERYSLPAQRRLLTEHCDRQGFAYTIYEDAGLSGETIAARPAMRRLLSDAARGTFEIALAVEMERFSRSRDGVDLATIKGVFRQSGIRFGTPAQLFDPDDVEDDFISGLLGLLASREKQKLARRTQEGRLQASRQGRHVAGVPYGYRRHDGRLLVYPPEAQIVRDMFSWLVDSGLSIRGIALRLQAQGTPPRKGGARWHWSSVQHLVTNESYAGLARYNRVQRRGGGRVRPASEWITVSVPAIIAPERFRQAQSQLRANTYLQPGRTRRTYLLRGIVHCALCGSSLQGLPANGKPHYRCKGKRGPTPCAKRITLAAPLDALVWDAVRRLILHPERVAAEVRRQRDSRVTRRDLAEMRLAHVRSALLRMPVERDRILGAYREGWITDADGKRQLQEIQRKGCGLESERRRLEVWLVGEAADEQTRTRLDEMLRRVRTRMDHLTSDERYDVVHAVVRDIRVDNHGGVELTSYLPVRQERPGGPSACGPDRYRVTSPNHMTMLVTPALTCG
jgi:DNA invertase Pin-like site-specific DNA recombinase